VPVVTKAGLDVLRIRARLDIQLDLEYS